MNGVPFPEGWPFIDGEALTYDRLVELVLRRDAWAAQVDALGIDAPPFPNSPEEEQAVRDAKAALEAMLLVAETERFLKDNEGPG